DYCLVHGSLDSCIWSLEVSNIVRLLVGDSKRARVGRVVWYSVIENVWYERCRHNAGGEDAWEFPIEMEQKICKRKLHIWYSKGIKYPWISHCSFDSLGRSNGTGGLNLRVSLMINFK
ncbi:hypothetical protein LINPERHAP1_LOCUS22210, partial [Linum perenne]